MLSAKNSLVLIMLFPSTALHCSKQEVSRASTRSHYNNSETKMPTLSYSIKPDVVDSIVRYSLTNRECFINELKDSIVALLSEWIVTSLSSRPTVTLMAAILVLTEMQFLTVESTDNLLPKPDPALKICFASRLHKKDR